MNKVIFGMGSATLLTVERFRLWEMMKKALSYRLFVQAYASILFGTMFFVPTTTAVADCVSKSDLVKGISVEFSDGSIETHRQSKDGRVIVEETRPNGTVDRWFLENGIYHVEHHRLQDGKPLASRGYLIDYGLPPSDLPVPSGKGEWKTTSTLNLPPDPPIRQNSAFVYQAPKTLKLGGCAYKVIRIESTTTAQGDVDIVGMIFFPQIGTSLTIELNGDSWRKPVRLGLSASN